MRTFINVEDIGDLRQALAEAEEIKKDRYKYQELGKNKTLLMIFFNNSLRTRLSTQKAATNLGMNVIVLDVNAGAWKLETERGVIMDGDKSEHLLEAIPVMGCYCDVIGVRSFAGLTDREYDYAETVQQAVPARDGIALQVGHTAFHPGKGRRVERLYVPVVRKEADGIFRIDGIEDYLLRDVGHEPLDEHLPVAAGKKHYAKKRRRADGAAQIPHSDTN